MNHRFWVLVLLTALLQGCKSLPHFDQSARTSKLVVRDVINCNRESAIYHNECWTALGLSDYILKWSPPRCTNDASNPDNDGTACCSPPSHPDEAWARCFLRLGRGDSRKVCAVINDGVCFDDGKMSPTLDPSIYNQVRYILKNIYDIYNFFSTYYTGRSCCVRGMMVCFSAC